LKGKSALLISLLFLLPTVIAVIMMVGFRQSYLSAGAFVLLLILSLGGCLLQWHLIVEKPAHDFLAALSRAINGDLRSRFSCSDKNPVFSVLSARFNEFMYQVENQTVELEENRRLQNQLYENEKIYRSALELTCERVFEADLTHNRLIFGRDQYRAAFPFLKTEMF
jgi:methyl-accepting chemotaxis protein